MVLRTVVLSRAHPTQSSTTENTQVASPWPTKQNPPMDIVQANCVIVEGCQPFLRKGQGYELEIFLKYQLKSIFKCPY